MKVLLNKKRYIILLIFIIMFLCVVPTFALSGEGQGAGLLSFIYKGKNINESTKGFIYPDFYFIDEKLIYYVNPKDNMIYKITRNGKQRCKLSEDKVLLNSIILNEGFIYYANADDFNCLYRINLSNNKKEKLTSLGIESPYKDIFVLNNNLYFWDGTKVKKLLNGKTEGGEDYLNNLYKDDYFRAKLQDKYIIYWNEKEIYKVDVNSGDKYKIKSGYIYPLVDVKGNFVYYINNEDFCLYRSNISNGQNEKISDIIINYGPDYDMGRFIIDKNYIFYTEWISYDSCKIVRTDLNGKNKKVIVEKACDFIIDDDYLYYFDSFDDGSMYKIKLDGNEKVKIGEGNYLYFIQSKDGLIFYGLKSDYIDATGFGDIFFTDGEKNVELN